MEKILAKAQQLADEQAKIDQERQQSKLDKDYTDIKLQLRAVLGSDSSEIIEGGRPYYSKDGHAVYLQNGEWLFSSGGWGDKPQCNVNHIESDRGYSHHWTYFTDLATFGRAIKSNIEEVQRQRRQKEEDVKRAEAYYNANPDWHIISLFKRLVFDLDARSKDGRDHLVPGQRLLVALAGYLADREHIPDWEDDSNPDDDSDDEGN